MLLLAADNAQFITKQIQIRESNIVADTQLCTQPVFLSVLRLYWDCTGDVLGLYWGCTGDVLELFGDSWGFVCLNLPASYCFVIAVCRCF